MTAMKEVTSKPAAFRVVFFDGERELDMGEVAIDAGLAFKKLQFLISDRIGLSPHQITLFLVRQRKARPSQEARRRTPIDEGTDFGALAGERDCVVLAQLKRTRRERRGRGRRNHVVGGGGGGGDELFTVEKKQALLPEKTILRRPAEFYGGVPAMAAIVPAPASAGDGPGIMGVFNYERLRNLRLQRERYLLSTAAAAYYPYAGAAAPPPYALDTPTLAADRGDGMGDTAAAAAACPVCAATREKPAPFHCCVYDMVVAEGFRSSVGPIQRPPKTRVHSPA